MELNNKLEKRISTKKFYFLYNQLMELIPLFAYLEKVNSKKNELFEFDNSKTTIGESS